MAIPREDQLLFMLDPLRFGSLASKRRYVRELVLPTFSRSSIGTGIGRDGKIHRFGIDVPRIQFEDLDGDGGRETAGLLHEPQETNACLWSEDLSQVAWGKSLATVTVDQTTAPDGSITADLVTATAGTGIHRVTQAPTSAIGPISGFLHAKVGTYQYLRVSLWNGTDTFVSWVAVDLTTGTVIGSGGLSGAAYAIEKLADGWYCIKSFGASQTAANSQLMATLCGPTGNESITAAGTETVYVWGTQVELAMYPSSYIPTAAAAASRQQEATSFVFSRSPQTLTWYADVLLLGVDYDSGVRFLGSIGSSTPRTFISVGNSDGVRIGHQPGSMVNSVFATTFAYRDRWEIAGQLFSDGSVRMYCSKNGGTIQSAGQSAGLAFASSWLDPKLVIGVGAPRVWYRKLIIAGSVFTMPEMRAV